MTTDPVVSEKRHSTPVEGLRVNLLTALSGAFIIASTAATFGLYMSKMTALEGRIDMAERMRAEDKAVITGLKQDFVIMDMRVKHADDTRQTDTARINKIAVTVDDIGRMVQIMCEVSPRRPGVSCSLGQRP